MATLPWLIFGLLASAVVAPLQVRSAGIVATHCGARVAVLGADMSAGGRFEVQRTLHVGAHTIQVDETVADETAQARGLIPPYLLYGSKHVAVSSVLLGPLPAGSGLMVTLNQAITLDTAQTYANALLTAGISDAEVRVAAPTSQQAFGTTALLGLFRAAQLACVPVSQQRQDLAIREVVLTSNLATSIGRFAAPELLFSVKTRAVSRHLTAAAALSGLITGVAAGQGVSVPAAQLPGLVAYLHDLVASGVFAPLVAAHISIDSKAPLAVALHVGAKRPVMTPSASPTASTASATPTAAATAGQSTVVTGTLWTIRSSGIAVKVPGLGVIDFGLASHLSVMRNGQVSSYGALQVGDAITVTRNAAGQAVTIQARSAAAVVPATAVPSPTATASSSGPIGVLNTAAIYSLAALLVLALLLLPLLVGWARKRSGIVTMSAPTMAMTKPVESDGSAAADVPLWPNGGPRAIALVPKGIDRAPFKRKGRANRR